MHHMCFYLPWFIWSLATLDQNFIAFPGSKTMQLNDTNLVHKILSVLISWVFRKEAHTLDSLVFFGEVIAWYIVYQRKSDTYSHPYIFYCHSPRVPDDDWHNAKQLFRNFSLGSCKTTLTTHHYTSFITSKDIR